MTPPEPVGGASVGGALAASTASTISLRACQLLTGLDMVVIAIRRPLFPTSRACGQNEWFEAPVISMAWVRISPLPPIVANRH